MFSPFKLYKGLPKSIYYLFSVQVINRLGDFVAPFLTLFLTSQLQIDTKTTGVLVTLSIVLQIPGSMLGGRIADRISRKLAYGIAQGLSGLCILLCAFTSDKVLLIVLLCASAFFSASVRPVINTMAFDQLSARDRKTGSSFLYLGINIGVTLGPAIAGFLFHHHLKLFFIGDAFTSFIAIGIVMLKIKEKRRTIDKITTPEAADTCSSSGSFIRDLFKNKSLLLFFLLMPIYSLVYEQLSFSLPLMLQDLFGDSGPTYYGYVFSINAIVVISLTAFITVATKKMPIILNTALAGVFFAVGFGMIGFINSFGLFAVSTVLWTVGEILLSTNVNVYIVNNCPENTRARFTAFGMIANTSGRCLSTLIMGGFIELFGIKSVWPMIMLISIIASLLTYLLYKHKQKKESAAIAA